MSLSPDNTAVVLIDWQERLVSVMPEKAHERHLGKACQVLAGAAAAGVPVLVTEQYPKGLGNTLEPLVEVLPEGVVPFEKRDFPATAVPEFCEALEALERPNVVLLGMEAHICVFQTARGLVEAGYAVHVPRDGVVSRNTTDYLAALDLCQGVGAQLTSVEAVLFDWVGRAQGPLFKTVSRLVR